MKRQEIINWIGSVSDILFSKGFTIERVNEFWQRHKDESDKTKVDLEYFELAKHKAENINSQLTLF